VLILRKGCILRVCLCCGVSHSTTSDDFYKIDRFYNKPVVKAKTDTNKKVVSEIVFVTVCDNCNQYVIEIKRYSLNGRGKKVLEETQTLRGADAFEYYLKTSKNRVFYPLQNPFESERPQSQTIPFIYGKTLSATEQIPRYIDESDNAGDIITSEIVHKEIQKVL